MKLPAFDYARRNWDRYREFYVEHDRNFVQFETGELIVTGNFSRPRDRRMYSRLELTVFTLRDQPDFLATHKLRDPESGVVVLRSWLTPDVYLYDHSSARVVPLSWRTKEIENMPSRLHSSGARAYFAGEGRMPQVSGKVTYAQQNTLTAEERGIIKEKLLLIKAKVRVGAVPESYIRPGGDCRVLAREVLLQDVAGMSDDFIRDAAKYGVKAGHTVRNAAWLEVRS